LTQKIDLSSLPSRLGALRKTGVPYPAGYEQGAAQKELQEQSAKVVANLKQGSVNNVPADSEIVALIAYLQRLGTDIKAAPAAQVTVPKTASVDQPAAARNGGLL
jgi:cytochrome c oxidase cbb3-type subunit I/II